MYHIHISRVVELNNVIKDGVQQTYDLYVKERKHHGVWNNATKINATEQTYDYVASKMILCGLGSRERILRLIKDEVHIRKITNIQPIRNRIELV